MAKNWEKLSQTEFKGAFKTFYTKRYKLSDGSIYDFDISLTPGGFVNVFALTPDYKVITAKQFRPGPEKILYEIPAGLIDPGEDLRSAAKRELREETGYEAQKLILLAKNAAHNPYIEGFANHFLAMDCKLRHKQELDAAEEIEIELIPLKKYVKEILRKGLVAHADGAWLALDYLVRNKQITYSDIM